MKHLRLLLVFTLLCSISSAEEKVSMLRIFEKASFYLKNEEKFTSIERLQRNGVTIAYFFSVKKNKEKKKIGIMVDKDLNVTRPARIEDLTQMRYSPPRIEEVIHKEDRRFNTPTINEEDYLRRGLEPAKITHT